MCRLSHPVSVLALSVWFIATAEAAKSCGTTSQLPSDNLCADVIDAESGAATPNCVNMGTQLTPDWRCARCAVNCDCGPGEYCVRTAGPSAGTCAELSAVGKIGKPCTSFGLPGTPGARIPVKGVDDVSICGSAVFDELTGDFAEFEWLGSCTAGICRQCTGGAGSWALALSAQMVPSTRNGSYGGSLVCGERTCVGGVVVAQPTWVWDYYPTGVVTCILVFVIVIFVTTFCASIAECCARCRGRRLTKVVSRKKPRAGVARKQQQQHVELTEVGRFVIGEDGDEEKQSDGKRN